MPTIHTLIPDIQALLTRKDGWLNDTLAQEFATEVAGRLARQYEAPKTAALRLSRMGPQCPRALWHSIHTPGEAEALPPWAENKFSFGHIIEAWAITLAKAAGHTVTGEQDEVVVDGVAGHRDCVIDGCVVDVKSAASKSFIKFKDKSLKESDTFGYLEQLDGYLVGSLSDDLVLDKEHGYLFAIDKQLGHMCLYEHIVRIEHIRERIRWAKDIIAQSSPPACTCRSVKDGESGNFKLDVAASYNAYKYCCKPFIRTFLYADGPRYLTTVARRPKRQDGSLIPEIDRYGKIVYN